jgi:hypothetical protein
LGKKKTASWQVVLKTFLDDCTVLTDETVKSVDVAVHKVQGNEFFVSLNSLALNAYTMKAALRTCH